jgi:hypothetical protein
MVEAASTSQKFYQTTRRNNPEDSQVHTHRRENLNSHNKRGRRIKTTAVNSFL